MEMILPIGVRIANRNATVLFVIGCVIGLFGIGSAGPSLEWVIAGRMFRVNGAGVEFEFGPPRPHVIGGPNGTEDDQTGINFMGLICGRRAVEWRNAGVRCRTTIIGFPFWPFLVPFLIPLIGKPIYRLLCKIDEDRIRARAKISTHCLVCGYDLRATPQRCPECGTIPAGSDENMKVGAFAPTIYPRRGIYEQAGVKG